MWMLRFVVLLSTALVLVLGASRAAPATAQSAPPIVQNIIIETPPAGTQVGSPMVITGNLATLPSNTQLVYSVLASDGRVLGEGSFPVPGVAGQPAYFIASLSFSEPREGDAITLRLKDLDPASGAVVAETSLPLVTAPLPQRIQIATPPSGTRVGNPVVVTGSTLRFPPSGNLGYAIYDAAGAQVGGGVFPVSGNLQDGGQFNASIPFAYPPLGGPLRIDLYDQDPGSGAFLATATLQTATAALVQQITIETPPAGTQVGSPMVITGRATRFPSSGALQYRITDARGVQLGAGAFPVQRTGVDAASFSASISFQPPATNGPIRAQIYEIDQFGRFAASAVADMRWGP